MKIIHISDLHLGKFFEGRYPHEISSRLREDVWESLIRLTHRANHEGIELMLIAGDIFEREFFRYRDFERLIDIFKRCNFQICMIFGNHDYMDSGFEVFINKLPENVHAFGNEFSHFDISNLKVRIFGISYDFDKNDVKLPEPEIVDGWDNICILHGEFGDTKYLNFDLKYFNNFDYVALGHIHKFKKLAENACYSGVLEPYSFSESGECGYVFIDTRTFEIEFIPFSKKKFVIVKYHIQNSSINEIFSEIQNKIDSTDYVKLILSGSFKDKDFLLNYLRENLNSAYLEIVDEMNPIFEIDEILKDHSDDFLGEFIKRLNTQDSLSRRALEIGLSNLVEEL